MQLGMKLAKRLYLWFLVSLMIVVSVIPGCTSERLNSSNTHQVQDVTSQEAFSLIQDNEGNPGFIILDVRTAEEFADGQIASALNIDVNLPSFREEMEKLDKNDAYLVYCRTGNRSRNALRIMGGLGFTRIYHLANGINEWNDAGLPLRR